MAEILHEFHRRRADISYARSSAAGRTPACCTTATNSRQMQDGELLLIDAGCEFDYYASDVTRTLPVGGRYSRRQRAVYEVVLEAQRAAIAKVRAGGALERAARGGGARHHAGARAPRPAEGPRAEADQGRRLPPVLHAPRRPLARHGRARRRRVQGRRPVAAAGAGHGHHHRARHLHPAAAARTCAANGGASACASRTTSSSPTASRKC